MWLLDVIRGMATSLLLRLGLANKNAKILFLGLDNAGKTTLLHILKGEASDGTRALKVHLPTQQPTMEELQIAGCTFKAFDLGGHDIARKVWKDYYPQCDAVVFLVDAFDRGRFIEAKNVLDGLLTNSDVAEVPFLVLGNKIDLGRAASEDELLTQLGLSKHMMTGKDAATLSDGVRPMECFMISVVRGSGYAEGFRWLSKYIK